MLAAGEVQYLSCCWVVDVRCSAAFDCDLTVTVPDRLWAVMLRRISKWRFIRSKVFLIEFVETNFADLTDCSAIFSCLSSFSVFIGIAGISSEEGPGEESVYIHVGHQLQADLV